MIIRQPSKRRLLTFIYLPWILSELFDFNPIGSYLIAWLGSFFIYYLTIVSSYAYHNRDLPVRFQVMRPIILVQLVFAGFMCSTSIFFFLNHLGYHNFQHINTVEFQVNSQTELIAKCQRLSLLAHIGLVSGIIIVTRLQTKIKYRIIKSRFDILSYLCVFAFFLSVFVSYFPPLSQFKYTLLNIAIASSALLTINGITKRKVLQTILCALPFGYNLVSCTLTGYKENIISNMILICFVAFPYYKRAILFVAPVFIYSILYMLPTFTGIIRMQSWWGNTSKEIARENAYQALLTEENNGVIQDNNWEFLTNRFSEAGMFVTYIKKVPSQQDYYGFELLLNSLNALIPRAVWSEKPNTENIAMERVYQLGVAQRSSTVSAKTRPMIDGYLMAGAPGVYLLMLTYGIIIQSICNQSEKLFGGYQIGCIVIFNGIFQQLWRGNAIEFLLNNIVYGYLLMITIHFILKKLGLIHYNENRTYNAFL